MGAHEVAEPCALPVLADHQVLRFREALDALTELLDELVDRPALPCGLQRHSLHHGELVLGAVGELAHEELGTLLAQLELR